jgi:hypothetical protein
MIQSVVSLNISEAFRFLAGVTRKKGAEMCVTPPYEMGRLAVEFYTDVVIYLLEGHNYVLYRNIVRPSNGFNRFIHL